MNNLKLRKKMMSHFYFYLWDLLTHVFDDGASKFPSGERSDVNIGILCILLLNSRSSQLSEWLDTVRVVAFVSLLLLIKTSSSPHSASRIRRPSVSLLS
jgi:hypothetical protein